MSYPLSDISPFAAYALALIAFLWAVVGIVKRTKKRLPLPPGPKGLPLVKNLFDIPTSFEYETYERWGKIYGDVVYIEALNNKIVILNSVKAATELMDHRSAIYSDRPYIPMFHDPKLMDASFALVSKPYSRDWKRQRKLFTQYINPTSVSQQFSPKQLVVAQHLLVSLLSDPSDLKDALWLMAGRLILNITYGYDVKNAKDPFLVLISQAAVLNGEGLKPKYSIVNAFPALKYIPAWFPGAQFKAAADAARNSSKQAIARGFEIAKDLMASGNFSFSFAQTAISELREGHDPEDLQDIKDVSTMMYGAGAETTSATLHYLILQLVLHPEVQRRAQKELDRVVGSPDGSAFRLPTFIDRPSLPYIEAIFWEALRLYPIVPTGVPHASTQEDEYRGWRIPKGAIIIANAWGINHDETVYADPHKFKPERFIKTADSPAEPLPVAAFGFGRRVCPGRSLAENTLWIATASLLATFNFTPAKDKHGVDIDARYAQRPLPHFIIQPQPFPCSITPRSQQVEKIIREIEHFNVL